MGERCFVLGKSIIELFALLFQFVIVIVITGIDTSFTSVRAFFSWLIFFINSYATYSMFIAMPLRKTINNTFFSHVRIQIRVNNFIWDLTLGQVIVILAYFWVGTFYLSIAILENCVLSWNKHFEKFHFQVPDYDEFSLS